MKQATDEQRALIDEIGRHYSYYFKCDVRSALVASWLDMSVPELARIRDNWRALTKTVAVHRAAAEQQRVGVQHDAIGAT